MRNTVLRLTVLASLITLTTATQAAPPPRHVTLNTLSPNARQLFNDSMRLADASFDPATQLLHRPGDSHEGGLYMVRESSWYALGLLLRDHADDRKTAATILDAVLKRQYTSLAPQEDPTWYGTFKRSPEEPIPAHGTPWSEFDPNWRVFIGTIFQIILIEYPDRIPAPLADRLYQSIDTALLGELHHHRLAPSYSNIALMYGALWDFAAQHNPTQHPDWQSRSAQWNESVYQLFQLHDAFNEYNSPTYYGVDLYGLALLRDYASTPRLRTLASRMESALWTDIADFYSPTLRNISGPYDRSYGMDMESYVAVTGVWIRTLLPAAQAPLPNPLTLSTDHVADLWFAPQLVILGNNIPTVALHKLQHPSAPPPLPPITDDPRPATPRISPTPLSGGAP
ncbi:hypothetical protein, partial [Granulicella sp. dw_53]|uniref:hypothetical protein n=1 Tax=Granulicella sp. dw_53 TaxID=2719792 RepID=UPI001BD2D048